MHRPAAGAPARPPQAKGYGHPPIRKPIGIGEPQVRPAQAIWQAVEKPAFIDSLRAAQGWAAIFDRFDRLKMKETGGLVQGCTGDGAKDATSHFSASVVKEATDDLFQHTVRPCRHLSEC